MDLLIATGFSDAYAPLGKITSPRWQEYATKHGYRFKCIRDYPPELGHPTWQRLRHILEQLPSCEVLFFIGADCYCTNLDIDLADWIGQTEKPILMSGDFNSRWSSEGIIARHCPAVLNFFQKVLELAPKWAHQPYFREQSAISELGVLPEYADLIHTLPLRYLMSVPRNCDAWSRDMPDESLWHPGDFLLHAASSTFAQKLKLLTEIQAQFNQR